MSGTAARHLRRAAAFQQRPVNDVAADCVRDELHRDVYDVLYTNVEDYASTADGLSQRLALLVRELGALPAGDAAKAIAQAAAPGANPLQNRLTTGSRSYDATAPPNARSPAAPWRCPQSWHLVRTSARPPAGSLHAQPAARRPGPHHPRTA
ncbi:hypothetical protein STRTUCAR8_10246 [Streptomyces turgidiscabies Car8]|uniref:Uncharacterized protein n=1 Tax=Streptomyces turgidiscabies (strain Car8) TaxID=698760 RepID=L7F6R0_STRT8|nr:hypothetical protein STRTUCAR8_10246 [Streptomyces turgidiscabies Car8]